MGDEKIQSQMTRIVVVIYVITTLLASASVYLALTSKVQELGETFSIQYLLKEKSTITSPIEREVALVRKMVDTVVVREWVLHEENSVLQEMALKELEKYRLHFQDRSYFLIIDESKNYYYNDEDSRNLEEHYRYTLHEDEESDEWYFHTMAHTEYYALNVNIDRVLETTKVWINAIIYDDDGHKIGLAGTGITLDVFLDEFLESGRHYITPLLMDEYGFIMAYEDRDYIQLAALIREKAVSERTIFELIGSEEKEQVRDVMEQLKYSYIDGTYNTSTDEAATLEVSFGGENRIAALSFIPALNWYIVVLFNTSEVFSIWDFAPTMFALLLALLVISLSIMFSMRSMIITPINALTDFSRHVGEKNYHHRLSLDSNNEFGLLAHSFNDMARRIQDYTTNLEEKVARRTEELRETNTELASKNQKLIDNISYASYLQHAILPDDHLLESVFTDYFVLWQPRDAVGGDFYWLKEGEDQVLVAVIDCTGHGVPGALMTMTANAVLNRIIDTEHISSPALILEHYDRVMRETLYEDTDQFQRDDGLDIGLCAIEKSSGKITFAGASIDLFYVDIENPDQVVHIRGHRVGVGYQHPFGEVSFTDYSIETTRPTLYMTSDGYLDQNGGPENKRYSRKSFIELLQKIQGEDVSVQGEIIKEELECYKGSEPQRDDITVVGFRL